MTAGREERWSRRTKAFMIPGAPLTQTREETRNLRATVGDCAVSLYLTESGAVLILKINTRRFVKFTETEKTPGSEWVYAPGRDNADRG